VNGFITEYAIRVVYTPGQTGRITEYQHHLADARAAYDHEVEFHGADAVEFLTRQVRRTEWVAGKLPPKVVHRDDGWCGEILSEKPIRDVTTGGLL
jgi:hypothetical protein